MLDKKEIEKECEKASEASVKPSKVPGMTYEQGVSAALDWVLENVEEKPMED